MKWFKHDSNAHADAKIRKLIMKYGSDGYALYWYCIESIANKLDKNNITFELEHDAEILAYELKIDTLKVENIMRYMVELKLFEINQSTQRIVCLKLANRLDESASKNPEIRKVVNEARVNGLIVSSDKGYVYLFKDKELYKIGKTGNIHGRMRNFKTTNPDGIFLHTIESVDMHLLETIIQKLFKHKKYKGEWFNLDRNEIDFIMSIDDGDDFIREGVPTNSRQLRESIPTTSGADKIRLDKIRREKEQKKPAPKKKTFQKPSIQECFEHCKNQTESESFFNYYESNGWKVGRNKMVNWKSSLTNWVKRSQDFNPSSTNQEPDIKDWI